MAARLYCWIHPTCALALALLGSACSAPGDSAGPAGPRPVVVVPVLVADRWKADPVDIRSVRVDGDTLTLDVGFGGGCETHAFELVASSTFAESEPVQSTVLLSHDDRDDPCDAYLLSTIQFDLSPLAVAWHRAYGSSSGRMSLRLIGWSGAVPYVFR